MERLTGKTLAYMRCCRAALPHLRKSGRGRVICIAGTAARHAGATALLSAPRLKSRRLLSLRHDHGVERQAAAALLEHRERVDFQTWARRS